MLREKNDSGRYEYGKKISTQEDNSHLPNIIDYDSFIEGQSEIGRTLFLENSKEYERFRHGIFERLNKNYNLSKAKAREVSEILVYNPKAYKRELKEITKRKEKKENYMRSSTSTSTSYSCWAGPI